MQYQRVDGIERGTGVCLQFSAGGAADGMPDDRESVTGHAQHARHQFCRTDKLRCYHTHRRSADAFAADRVMQTARRATASVTETGNGQIPVSGRVDEVLLRRGAVV